MKADTEVITYSAKGVTCTFERRTGQLVNVCNQLMSVHLEGLLIDVGCDGEYAIGSLSYHSLDQLHTWEMPRIQPKQHENLWKFVGYNDDLRGIQMYYTTAGLELVVHYTIQDGNVEVSVKVKNKHAHTILINGVAFLLKQLVPDHTDITFNFPGNVPHQQFHFTELKQHQPVVTGLVNPVIQTTSQSGHLNVLFIDEEEKWGTGVYKDSPNAIHYVNVAGVESYLQMNETIDCGTLYLQLAGREDPFVPIRDLYRHKGWNPPTDGYKDGVLYSCHPHGTMDSKFSDRKTLREYAEEMQELKDMGIDHVWILPIFEHLDRGVYHPTDQKIIDPRYGGDEDVRYFSQKLHELGMTLLFDYVPHGPAPEDPLGKEHIEWASVDRNGQPKLEWDCLSFDMTNPQYRQYTTEMVEEHVDRFDIDGSRIDCAMGGLSNWNPVYGNRPSSSSLKGGVCISKAIRDGFLNRNKKPIVTPENFNPVPVYAPHTDIFYDMPLYRVLFEMEEANLSPKEYTRRLTNWLHAEMMSTPEKYNKLRFLGNHDSVSWVWQKARATEVYGENRAKALWVLMATIDGIPMLYQGDENAAIYKKAGPDLRCFFTELFQARKRWLGNHFDVQYLDTQTPIMAFLREYGEQKRLVVINMSPQQEKWTVDFTWQDTVYGQQQEENGMISLEGFSYSILRISLR